MKKIFLKLSVVLSVFIAFTGCGSQIDYYPIIETTADTPPYLDEPTPDDPHPLAAALKEYMAGYDGVVRAYLVTLDDDGTIGVLATRPTTRVFTLFTYESGEYVYRPPRTLFYIQDGELFQIDPPGFVSGRYNRLISRFHAHTHMVEFIYKLEYGRFEISTRLAFFSDEYLLYLLGEYDAAVSSIRRDALAEYAREKYGLAALLPPNLGHMRNTQDQTAQILAMTINCVPGFAATTNATSAQTNQISVIIGDTPVNFAVQQPILADGHVLAPVDELFDVLGFCVTWQPQTQQIRLLGAGAGMFIITLNDNAFTTGSGSYTLDVPIQVIGDSTMVPIRAILESIGYDVQWDEAAQTVIITFSN